MNKLLALLFLIFVQCSAPQIDSIKSISNIDTDFVSDSCIDYLGEADSVMFAMPITNKGYIGRAFISEHRLYTAKHICTEEFYIDTEIPDVFVLSDVDIHGLTTCREEHTEGDRAFTVAQNGHIEIILNEKLEFYYKARSMSTILFGDSGTPVFCYEHRHVIGLVSGKEPTNQHIFWIAVIQDERETSCEKKDEKKRIKKN